MAIVTTTALAAAAVVLAATATAVSTVGAYQGASAANASAEYNAKVMKRNQEIASMQAEEAKKQGDIDAREHRLRVASLIGNQRAAYGASGVLVDSGSPLDISMDTAAEGELDAMTIRRNAQRAAYGLQTQSLNYGAQSELSLMSRRSVGMATGSTLLTGLSNTLSSGLTAYSAAKGPKTV